MKQNKNQKNTTTTAKTKTKTKTKTKNKKQNKTKQRSKKTMESILCWPTIPEHLLGLPWSVVGILSVIPSKKPDCSHADI